jgi:hypothetical protein
MGTVQGSLTVNEVAARYAVSRPVVLGWIRAGDLHAVNAARSTKPGARQRWRITLADLAAFEAARQNGQQIDVTPAAPVRQSRPAARRNSTEWIE